jgi:multidrug efflux system outer membrane protein
MSHPPGSRRHRPHALLLATTLVALAGCATTVSSPPSTVAIPEGWGPGIAVTAAPAPDSGAAWWRDFGSAELDALVELALQSNADLRIAAARLAQARALADGAEADGRPQVGAVAGVQHGRQSSVDPKADLAYGGFRASWEIDVFGSKALAATAATRDAQGAELAQAAARVAVAADVATAYFDAQALRRRQAVSREAIATIEREIDVTRRRFEAGQLSALETDRLAADLRRARADDAGLQAQLHIRMRQLAVLLGLPRAPADLVLATPDLPDFASAPPLLPAELLERRPDVQRQARAVEAAVARLGVARRDLYPRIEFDWAGRKEWLKAQGGEAAPALVIGYGLSVSMPILDGGRIRANIAIHDAQAQEAMAAYEKAMLGALADAEIALRQLAAADASVSELAQAEGAGASASDKSQRLFAAGLVDLNTAIDVRREHLRVQDALLQARGARWAAAVAVRRAFAGAI